jgi:hypothetical protein
MIRHVGLCTFLEPKMEESCLFHGADKRGPFKDVIEKNNELIMLNGKDITDDDRNGYVITSYINSKYFEFKVCPYCSSGLSYFYYDCEEDDTQEVFSDWVYVSECFNCGFWQSCWHGPMCSATGVVEEWEAQVSKLAEFPNQIPEGCSEELAKYIRAKPNHWNEINPQKLEKLVSDIFKANHFNAEVLHVGQVNDGGVDILYIDSGARNWLIQVKRRSDPLGVEGVGTIRNLLGAMVLKGEKCGIVVSTADHFSYWAKAACLSAKNEGYTVELVDKGLLHRMITPLVYNRQWFDLVCRRRPDWVENISRKMPDKRQMELFLCLFEK